MEIIDIKKSNLDSEHVCCAISDKKGENCVASKKAWMKARFDEGLMFKKLNVRGKVFIEYMPAENGWCPVEAESYMLIGCFWVSGQYKGQGHADALLEKCIEDSRAKGKIGLTALSSKKKMPFLSDPGYLKYKKFEVCDTAAPYFELLYLPFIKDAPKPSFRPCCKEGAIEEKGWVLRYSHQCPHTEKYASLIAGAAERRGVKLTLIRFETKEQAQNAPSPFTIYSLFRDGKFVTNEILSEAKFIKMLEAAEK